MLNAIKYITIIISALFLIFVGAQGISILLQDHSDSKDFMYPAWAILFYIGVLILLNNSVKKNYRTGYWIAFALALLPVIGLVALLTMLSGMGC
jgi:hypothetical protein